ncbi:MAG: TIR domain-containing protein [Chloroflexi bacterium]|nr:TIR domain-containing protein [Chloroflexota bacterium]
MNVFISWSGPRSKRIAEGLRDWLPTVVQAIVPWVSFEDIEKGSNWDNVIKAELEKSSVGIFCLTPESLQSRWLNFEAGAIAAKLKEETLICTYLYGFPSPKEVGPPLDRFQSTEAKKDDTKKLLQDINRRCETPVRDEILEKLFELTWGDFDKVLTEVSGMDVGAVPAPRSQEDVIDEMAAGIRTLLGRGQRQRPPISVPISPESASIISESGRDTIRRLFGGGWICPACLAGNDDEATLCIRCDSKRPFSG